MGIALIRIRRRRRGSKRQEQVHKKTLLKLCYILTCPITLCFLLHQREAEGGLQCKRKGKEEGGEEEEEDDKDRRNSGGSNTTTGEIFEIVANAVNFAIDFTQNTAT